MDPKKTGHRAENGGPASRPTDEASDKHAIISSVAKLGPIFLLQEVQDSRLGSFLGGENWPLLVKVRNYQQRVITDSGEREGEGVWW